MPRRPDRYFLEDQRSQILAALIFFVFSFSFHLPLSAEASPSQNLDALKGNWVLVNFWASWCPPCLQELPSLAALAIRLKASKFTVLGVAVDEDQKAFSHFLTELSQPLPFVIPRDPKQLWARQLGTTQFPETYLFDPTLHLVKKWVGAQDWVSADKMRFFESAFIKFGRPLLPRTRQKT